MKLIIYHFQPLELYPPVMNDIIDFSCLKNVKVSVVSSSGFNTFSSDKAKIFRIGFKNITNTFYRYLHYLIYNISGVFIGLVYKPNRIIVYETYSIFPVYLLSKLNSNLLIHIHEHEFVSKNEIKKSSMYYKFLDRLVKKMLSDRRMTVSQTNLDRKKLYLTDNKFLSETDVFVFPNLPPIEWIQKSHDSKVINPSQIKFVHVGALGLESTYLKEFMEWIVKFDGQYTLDLYLGSLDSKIHRYLGDLNNEFEFIQIHNRVSYYELPSILSQYDIGLVLYNGYLPNFVFNVPNKVMEYLVCGLNVWYSKELETTTTFCREYDFKGCYQMDYKNIDNFNLPDISSYDNIEAIKNVYSSKTKKELLKNYYDKT